MATASEIEMRRARVLSLRLRRMTESAIAAICHVDESTVSLDLKWIGQNWRDRYGPVSTIDVAELVGESVAVYEDIELQAFLEHSRIADESRGQTQVVWVGGNPKCAHPTTHKGIDTLCSVCGATRNEQIVGRISPMYAARQRMACLRTALLAREMKLNLLQDLRVLDRVAGSVTFDLPRAFAIRAAFQKVRAAEGRRPELLSDAEKMFLQPPVVVMDETEQMPPTKPV